MTSAELTMKYGIDLLVARLLGHLELSRQEAIIDLVTTALNEASGQEEPRQVITMNRLASFLDGLTYGTIGVSMQFNPVLESVDLSGDNQYQMYRPIFEATS